jgi:hypothetical protein
MQTMGFKQAYRLLNTGRGKDGHKKKVAGTKKTMRFLIDAHFCPFVVRTRCVLHGKRTLRLLSLLKECLLVCELRATGGNRSWHVKTGPCSSTAQWRVSAC